MYKSTPLHYTPVGCVSESCLGTPALCVVDFFTPATTGEDTDTDDTNCKEERGEEGGDVSFLLLTLAASRTRVLVSVFSPAGEVCNETPRGAQRGHNCFLCWPRAGAFDLRKARMRPTA